MAIKVLSLFSGVGAMDLGLKRGLEDAETAAFVEWDSHAQRVLKHRFPGVPVFDDVERVADLASEGRLDELGLESIAPEYEADFGTVYPVADIVVGGFPCQDLSSAGCREGLSGNRSRYYHHMARIVAHTMPSVVLIENSANLLNLGFEVILGDFAELGYTVAWDLIPAEAVGAPHKRNRVFVVAHAPELPFSFRPPTERSNLTWWADRRVPPLHSTSPHHYPGYDIEPVGEKEERTPHHREQLARLGNAVVPAVAEHIGILLDDAFEGEREAVEQRRQWLSRRSEEPIAVYEPDELWEPGEPPLIGSIWRRPGPVRRCPPSKGQKNPCKANESCVGGACAVTKWPPSGVMVGGRAYSLPGETPPTGPKELYLGALVWVRKGRLGGVGDMYPAIVVGLDGQTSRVVRDPENPKSEVWATPPTGDNVQVEDPNGFILNLKRRDLHRFPTPAKTEGAGGMGGIWEVPGSDTWEAARRRGGQIRHWGSGQTPVNPRFVEYLMGLPEGWVSLPESSLSALPSDLLSLLKD